MSEKIKKVFHPGYYIKDYLDEIQMTQDEFAKRLGITGKQLSLLLNEQANITSDIAYKLSRLLGSSIEMWLTLQAKYDAYIIEMKEKENFEEEKIIYKMIDKDFLVSMNIIDKKDKISEGIAKLRTASTVSSLKLHTNKDIFCSYRGSLKKEESIENIVCKNVWVSIAFNLAKNIETKQFNEKLLKDNLMNFRDMTIQKPEYFIPKIKELLSECGVAFIVLPSLKNSRISGAVKWIENEKAMMAVNTRGAFNDRFWFSFFHELQHVLQKRKRILLLNEFSDQMEYIYEYDADMFAQEILIPKEKMDMLKKYDEASIIDFAKLINIHPGIVVGRLQNEGIIQYSQMNHLKEKCNFEFN
ncbi:MAG: HigA family addiction module antidote protein [Bacilli bacterium]|nr:HigA family addiction module antidote protein [Bacilli bacterium]